MALDATDWALLRELQRNARATMSELARAVSMSASAVTERVRRLEETGVLRGYHAEVSLPLVGLPILAFVRLRYPHGNYKPLHDLARLFDVGFRGEPARSQASGGAGLGLAITRGIVEAHHGSVEVAHVAGGCAFSVRLPSA